ncbi:cupin domain-containing protein [Clostridiaceae bacterium OttesenSCG-928-D20]|nr:cupin domain-containing protein [Clostridiaceae bacterium OttesenSCG-928-D20]
MEKKNKKTSIWVEGDSIESISVAENSERRILAYCEEMMCVENVLKPGGIIPVHSHTHTQITYVQSGVFDFTIDKETKRIKEGDSCLLQDAVPHGAVCIEEGILLDIFTPIRDDFLQ